MFTCQGKLGEFRPASKLASTFVLAFIEQSKGSLSRGGDSRMKVTGMLVVSLRGVNCGFCSRLGFTGRKAKVLTCTGIASGCALRNIYMKKKTNAVNL